MVVASAQVETTLLVLKLAFLVLLYIFIWRIVRSAARDLRLPQESMILRPHQAAGLLPQPAAARSSDASSCVKQPGARRGRHLHARPARATHRPRQRQRPLRSESDEYASTRHVRIEPRRDGIWVEDIGSTNGTFVNGIRLTRERRLVPGDIVRIGETRPAVRAVMTSVRRACRDQPRQEAPAERRRVRLSAAALRRRRRHGRRSGRRGRLGARGVVGLGRACELRPRRARKRREGRRRPDPRREPARPPAGDRRRVGVGHGNDDDGRARGGDDTVTIGHVGDSRAYLLRAGALEQLTDDHSLVAELVRRGELSPEEAEVHPQRSVITRALGTDPNVDVDVFSVETRAGDVFLLCSDGLATMVDVDAIAEILERNRANLERGAPRADRGRERQRRRRQHHRRAVRDRRRRRRADDESLELAEARSRRGGHAPSGGWRRRSSRRRRTAGSSKATTPSCSRARPYRQRAPPAPEPAPPETREPVCRSRGCPLATLVILILAGLVVALAVWGLAR